jgi:protein-S-isoprenylcysteine O-methyltransferase Ste14
VVIFGLAGRWDMWNVWVNLGIAVVLFAFQGLALNSLLAIIPAVMTAPFVARMTAIEDRMLRNELDGYAEYAAHVRSHLIPGLW